MRILNSAIINKTGEMVELSGWVSKRRDHGKIIFIDLRDQSGISQLVFAPSAGASTELSRMSSGQGPKDEELYKKADTLRLEWVIEIKGEVKKRPAGMENKELLTGEYEIEVKDLKILAEAKTPPFEIDTDGYDLNEEIRMKYRYLDLRRERMKNNLILRHKITSLVRQYLNDRGFIEIETPMLTKTSPEGARDFLVPSRLQPGKFYALPQAPQQYKQLLMIAGFERYYQIARAIRDEDMRGNRQLEHTQIDLEMSFAGEGDVRDLVEGLMIYVAESCGKKILEKPFPLFTHEEAIKKFGADKFDLREDKTDANTLAFAWVTDFPLFSAEGGSASGGEWDEKEKKYTFAHNPFSAPKSEYVPRLMKGEDLGNLRAQQYDLVCNGEEIGSGGVRISDPSVQRKVFELMGLTPEETEERFGHLLRAYEYGAPPHAGMAPGLDRLVMLIAGEPNIREVIPFPVSSSGQTSVMDAPSEVDEAQLRELHLKVESRE